MSEREDDGDVDPRFDPRFQRGYDPARHPSRSAGRPGAGRSPFARPEADEGAAEATAPFDESLYIRPMPPVSADAPPPAGPADPEDAEPGDPHDADDADETEDDARVERGSSRLWLIGLAALSAIATVVGAIGILTLLTEPPLRLTLAAETVPTSLRIALELISGPVLAAGLVGVAVTLVLVLAGRRDRR